MGNPLLNKHNLILIRGVSGSGKTSFAEFLIYHLLGDCTDSTMVCADSFFYDEEGNYNFDSSRLWEAHEWCRESVKNEMIEDEGDIIVHNTFTTQREIDPYIDLAAEHDYNVISLIVENRHGNKDVHNVPEDILDRQERRLRNSIKLR